VLETDDFAPPIDAFEGRRMVIETLFDYPPHVLRPFVPDLEQISRDRGFDGAVRRLLESKLAVLAGDFAALVAAWERFDPKVFADVVWHPELLEQIGDVRACDPAIIEILIQTVSTKMMFGPRLEAVRSLGKIGAPAGPRAVQVIRNNIYDSEPYVVALRDRVIARIETAEGTWQPCLRCFWGRVPGRDWNSDRHCQQCLGLGQVGRDLV
jgi:hypothetical protein